MIYFVVAIGGEKVARGLLKSRVESLASHLEVARFIQQQEEEGNDDGIGA